MSIKSENIRTAVLATSTVLKLVLYYALLCTCTLFERIKVWEKVELQATIHVYSTLYVRFCNHNEFTSIHTSILTSMFHSACIE